MNRCKKDYREVVRLRMAGGILIVLMGAALMVTMLALRIPASEYSKGFYMGFGCIWMLAGAIMFVKNLRVYRSPERLRQAEIKERDERNQSIILRAYYITAAVLIFALSAGIIVYVNFNQTVSQVLCAYLYLAMATFVVAQAILRKKL